MVFLNPSFLWLSAAAGIPVIIHLFNLRRPKTVLFSNVAALKELQRSVTRRLQIKQWILLAIRILTILALAFAFARPVFPGGDGSVTAGTRSSVILIIDDSWSMTAGDEQGPYWLQARATAMGIINAYGETDEFQVMPLSQIRQHASFTDKEIATGYAGDIRPNGGSESLANTLNRLPALYSRAKNHEHHLYFLSDFQKSTIMDGQVSANIDSLGVNVHLIPLSNRQERNVYLGDCTVQQLLVQAGNPMDISVRVVNDHPEPVKDLGIRLVVEGITVATATIDIGPGQQELVNLKFTPQKPGWLSGWVEIDDQPVTFDNKRYFSISVPSREPVLLVQGDAPVSYLDVLFGEVFTTFETDRISYKQLAGTDISKYHAIILAGAGQLSPGVNEKLEAFVQSQGGLILIPDDIDGKVPYQGLCAMLGLPGFKVPVQVSAEGISASSAELEHPVFKHLFKPSSNSAQMDAPVVFRYYPIDAAVPGQSLAFLKLQNGAPAIIDHILPTGQHIFQFTFPLNGRATDLPLKSLFPPIMLRMANMASHAGRFPSSIEIGSEQQVRIPGIEAESFRLSGADTSVMFIPEVTRQAGDIFLGFGSLPIPPGNYTLEADGQMIAKTGFNIPDNESRMSFAAVPELENYIKGLGIRNISISTDSPEVLAGTIHASREGTQVWKWLLLAALVFIFAEILIVKYLPS